MQRLFIRRPDEACTIDVMEMCDRNYGRGTRDSQSCHEGSRDRYLLSHLSHRHPDSNREAYMQGYWTSDKFCTPHPWQSQNYASAWRLLSWW